MTRSYWVLIYIPSSDLTHGKLYLSTVTLMKHFQFQNSNSTSFRLFFSVNTSSEFDWASLSGCSAVPWCTSLVSSQHSERLSWCSWFSQASSAQVEFKWKQQKKSNDFLKNFWSAKFDVSINLKLKSVVCDYLLRYIYQFWSTAMLRRVMWLMSEFWLYCVWVPSALLIM